MRVYCKLSTVVKVVVAALVTGMVLGGGATHAVEAPTGPAGIHADAEAGSPAGAAPASR
jgi:hypothetical protein